MSSLIRIIHIFKTLIKNQILYLLIQTAQHQTAYYNINIPRLTTHDNINIFLGAFFIDSFILSLLHTRSYDKPTLR